MLISVNGVITESDTMGFPIRDAGYLYGYGCFETLRVVDGVAERWDGHLDRLSATALFLGIKIPFSKDQLREQFDRLSERVFGLDLLEKKAVAMANIYLSAGDRAAGFSEFKEAQIIMVIRESSTTSDLSRRAKAIVQTELSPRNQYAEHKLMAYLPSIIEQRRANGKVPLLVSASGELYESPSSAILGFKADCLFLNSASFVLPSVTAKYCAEQWQNWGHPTQTKAFTIEDLAFFDEICLVNAMGVTLLDSVADYPNLRSGDHSERLACLFR